MCRQCDPTPLPYLAGEYVLFTYPRKVPTPVTEDTEWGQKVKWITVETDIGPYIGVVVSHHRGWVGIRTKQSQFTLKPGEAVEHVLAIVDKEAVS